MEQRWKWLHSQLQESSIQSCVPGIFVFHRSSEISMELFVPAVIAR